ncbi:MAG: NADH:flavin oxidoreductase [Myxococcota bacterium]
MSTDTSPLFKPFRVRGLEVPNRVVMAPMTRSKSPGGVPTRDVRDYYARRAAADVGLILSEGTTLRRAGASNDAHVPNFHTSEALDGWRSVLEGVHAAGGKMGPQLWHVGMLRKPGTGPHPEAASDSPSGLTHKGKAVLPEPTDEEVQDMAQAYADAAREAVGLGFDCVEIHGAHGYLIDQFFWSTMNQRSDRWGGPGAVDRTAFAAEVVRLTRAAVGEQVPISFRWSQWKQQDFTARLAASPEALETFLAPIVEAGVDLIHASTRRFWVPEFPEVDGEDGLNLAGWCKKLMGTPVITVGSVGLSSDFILSYGGQGAEARTLDELMTRLDRGEVDLVAVGRALLQDPFWATKVKEGRADELKDFDAAALGTYY